jgi:DNA-binding NarL/FixJ family response regulator
MTEPRVRVLVVDDFAQWRRVVRTALQAKLALQVFEEAADGLEAVQKAQDLQPDLVVLDIGLPTLNGIEVARRIRSISPKSKVVFLTENHCCDVVEAALQEGASGYVIKSAFASELIPAVEAVLEGRPISKG